MATVEIPLGAIVRLLRTNGARESYTFLGSDEDGSIFDNGTGLRNADALDRPYASITIEPQEPMRLLHEKHFMGVHNEAFSTVLNIVHHKSSKTT
ncbi:MAG TPA: hypothetical protein VIE65_12980 [Methylobacter sp.]|jgi:hypothetical protein